METLNPPVIKVKKDEWGALVLDQRGVDDYTTTTALHALKRLPAVLKRAVEVRNQPDFDPETDTGICAIFKHGTTCAAERYEIGQLLLYCFSTWEGCSGDYLYPVPSPCPEGCPVEAFGKLELWHYEYGYKRAQLFIHCLHTLVQFGGLRNFYGIKD